MEIIKIYTVVNSNDEYITVNDEVLAKKLKDEDSEILYTKFIKEN